MIMGKCPNCGNKGALFGLTLDTDKCIICGKECCEKCGRRPLFWYAHNLVTVCSEECLKTFLEEIEPHVKRVYHWLTDGHIDGIYVSKHLKDGYASYISEKPKRFPEPIDDYIKKWSDDDNNVIKWIYDGNRDVFAAYFEHKEDVDGFACVEGVSRVPLRLKSYLGFYNDPHQSSYGLFEEIHKFLKEEQHERFVDGYLSSAKYCEKAGRYEDAAKELESVADRYEKIGMFDRARQMRARARQLKAREKQILVKHTVVDLNKLIQQVKDGGIVVVYRCPHCGGKLKIGKRTSVKSLKVCEHCGSEIEAMELADFLRTALS